MSVSQECVLAMSVSQPWVCPGLECVLDASVSHMCDNDKDDNNDIDHNDDDDEGEWLKATWGAEGPASCRA